MTAFLDDVFISYAHLDNVELVAGHKGWVANLEKALEARLPQLLGKEVAIWWDPKLRGNDDFEMTLAERLRRVAALVAVVTPRYVRSEWARKELEEFCAAAEQQGGVRLGDKVRIFKVLKTPVPLTQHPPALQALLGYEFFKVDEETKRVTELDEVFGTKPHEFWTKLDDLARDMCGLLRLLESSPDAPALDSDPIYLAVTTADLKNERDAIKRDLEQHGHTVLPDRQLPTTLAELEAMVREDLRRCRMSIHMVGATLSLVPEGGVSTLVEMQNELAIERGATGSFSRLVWIPEGLQVADGRSRQIIERLKSDLGQRQGSDLLERPLEDLRTMIAARLKKVEKTAAPGSGETSPGSLPRLYLMCDQRDAERVDPWAQLLFKDFEVARPIFEGDEADLRAYHDENLASCDGVLLFYGVANELWLRRKMREIQKSAGYGRTKPAPVVGVCLISPRTPEKEQFRTHDAIVVPQWDGVAPEALKPFVAQVKEAWQSCAADAIKKAV